MRFLVIEDNTVCREFLAMELAGRGEVHAFADGEQGLVAFAKALESGEFYDVVFMDIMLPGQDGHRTLERMRALEDAAGLDEMQRVPAVMVSALEDRQHMARAFFRGRAVEYLQKPVSTDKLAEILARFAPKGS